MVCESNNMAQRFPRLGRNLPSLLGHKSIMDLSHHNFLLCPKYFSRFYTSYTKYNMQHNIISHGRGTYLRQRVISEEVAVLLVLQVKRRILRYKLLYVYIEDSIRKKIILCILFFGVLSVLHKNLTIVKACRLFRM